jgi:hypothetical protein
MGNRSLVHEILVIVYLVVEIHEIRVIRSMLHTATRIVRPQKEFDMIHPVQHFDAGTREQAGARPARVRPALGDGRAPLAVRPHLVRSKELPDVPASQFLGGTRRDRS